MYIKNNIGPSADPCGTLKVTGSDRDELVPSNTTFWVHSDKNDCTQW